MNALPAARIVDAVADAARRWTDADFPPRVRATREVVARTGYSEPVVEYALDRLFGGLRADVLGATIAGEVGSLAALDGFVARAGRPDVFFRGVRRAVIIASRTTIGVALAPLVFALCAKVDRVVVKDQGDTLLAEFIATLAQERPELAARVALETWRGSDTVASREHAESADVVVAFGGAAALRAIRDRLEPDARFVPFGPRTSVAYVAREALTSGYAAEAVARNAARDALLYDGDGCLSLHALFVERGAAIEPAVFARLLARACDAAAVEFPAGPREPDAAFVAYRRGAHFLAAQGSGAVHQAPDGRHVVAYDPPPDRPPPLLSRTLAVYPVAEPAEARAYLARHALPLEGFARTETARADVLELALASGASRIAALGTLQDPPLGGEHGGEGRILPFVRAIYRT